MSLPAGCLDVVGLLILAEIGLVARNTILAGEVSYVDALALFPGFHRQQDAISLNEGEYPTTANMVSGYVFRVENQATVHYLQQVGRTGHLTTLQVSADAATSTNRPSRSSYEAALGYLPGNLTMFAIAYMFRQGDFWAAAILLALIAARFTNIAIVSRRCDANWHGAKEPGQHGDLIILLSQDRWIRMKGLTDDLKAVTSGQWLRDKDTLERFLECCVKITVYLCAALMRNASQNSKLCFVGLLLINSLLLFLNNERIHALHIKGRTITVDGNPKLYKRRLDLAEQLVQESGRNDWALKLGMVNQTSGSQGSSDPNPQVQV